MSRKIVTGELRIPLHFLSSLLAEKRIGLLRFFTSAKLFGHRCEIKNLCQRLNVKQKTCERLVEKLVQEGWAGTDGTFLFPRAWSKLNLIRRGGLYITQIPKDKGRFEALCFAKALKRIYRGKGSLHSTKGRVMQKDFPARYLSKALGISGRRFERLKSTARKYKFISVFRQFTIVGDRRNFASLRRNLHDVTLIKRGKHVVVPEISKIKFLI